MTGFPSLKELVERELARRQEDKGLYPSLAYQVNDGDGAMTDAKAAAKATIEGMEIGRAGTSRGRVHIASGIRAAVDAELRVVYPQRLIVARVITNSPFRHAERPDTPNYEAEIDAAVARAQARFCSSR